MDEYTKYKALSKLLLCDTEKNNLTLKKTRPAGTAGNYTA